NGLCPWPPALVAARHPPSTVAARTNTTARLVIGVPPPLQKPLTPTCGLPPTHPPVPPVPRKPGGRPKPPPPASRFPGRRPVGSQFARRRQSPRATAPRDRLPIAPTHHARKRPFEGGNINQFESTSTRTPVPPR